MFDLNTLVNVLVSTTGVLLMYELVQSLKSDISVSVPVLAKSLETRQRTAH